MFGLQVRWRLGSCSPHHLDSSPHSPSWWHTHFLLQQMLAKAVESLTPTSETCMEFLMLVSAMAIVDIWKWTSRRNFVFLSHIQIGMCVCLPLTGKQKRPLHRGKHGGETIVQGMEASILKTQERGLEETTLMCKLVFLYSNKMPTVG